MLSTIARTLLAFIVSMFISGAQLEGQTLDLVKIGQVFAGDPTAEYCGDYFILFESPTLFPAGPRVWVEVSTPGRVTTLLLRRDQLKVIIDKENLPSAEVQTAQGSVLMMNPGRMSNVIQPKDISIVTVHLNQKEYQKSAECLPPPE